MVVVNAFSTSVDREPTAGGPSAERVCSRPLRICHVIYRMATGGLENGLVNLINRMDSGRFQHAIVCVTDSTPFAHRIERADVPIVELHKRPGHDLAFYRRAWRAFRDLRPDLVHTRNTAGLDAILPARLAGIRFVLHGEHGRTAEDPEGANPRHNLLRRGLSLFITGFTTVSQDLADWLTGTVRIPMNKVQVLMNGVDVDRFHPGPADRRTLLPGLPEDALVVGAVGRLDPVKGHDTLIDAFHLLGRDLSPSPHLVIVGDGPQRSRLQERIDGSGQGDVVHLVGERRDIPRILRCFDIFSLPSLSEGISNTLLEAMASGLPVVATAAGGNRELVVEGETGLLVQAGDGSALAEGLRSLVVDSVLRQRMGQAGRQRACDLFSLDAMVRRYEDCYVACAGRG